MRNKILIVKSEKRDIKKLIHSLEDEYTIVILNKGKEIVESIKKEGPSAILIDVMYLEEHGDYSVKKIKENDLVKEIPVIFIVDASDFEGQKKGNALGGVEYIPIPFVEEIIKKRIKAQCDAYEVRRKILQKQEETIARDKETIKIRLLGEFSIEINGKIISAEMNRSKKMWQMLQYLIVYRERKITGQELIELLWPDEQVEKPAYALKTLSYRVRKVLEQLEVPYAKNLIQATDGSYAWNMQYPCQIDIDDFEKICREAEDPTISLRQKMEFWEDALKIYRGEYFICSGIEHWMIHLQTYYYNLWMNAASNLMHELKKQERYDKIIDLGHEYLQKDQLNENLQYYFMWALTKTGKKKEIIEYYNRLTALFMEEIGERPSKKIEQLYLQAIINDTEEIRDRSLRKGIAEKDITAPYFCELHIFKNIYEIEQHRMLRNMQDNFIILMGVEENIEEKLADKYMEQLYAAIMNSLRSGDVVTKKDRYGYMMLLQSISQEQCKLVIQRIIKRIHISIHPIINYSIEQILPNKQLFI